MTLSIIVILLQIILFSEIVDLGLVCRAGISKHCLCKLMDSLKVFLLEVSWIYVIISVVSSGIVDLNEFSKNMWAIILFLLLFLWYFKN